CHSPEVGAAVKATALDTDQLRDILNADGEPARTELLARMMQQPTLSAAFDALAAAVARYIGDGAAYAARECTALLDGPDAHTGEPKAVAAARRIVRAYYANFELYDLLAFPIVYSTAVGD